MKAESEGRFIAFVAFGGFVSGVALMSLLSRSVEPSTAVPPCDSTLVRQLGTSQAKVIAREVKRMAREDIHRLYDHGDPRCFTTACTYWRAEYVKMRDAPMRSHQAGDYDPFTDVDAMLYPQNARRYALSVETMTKLQRVAAGQLKAIDYAHPDVIAHWRKLAAGEPPFGLRIAEDKR